MENIELFFERNSLDTAYKKPSFRGKFASFTCQDKEVTFITLKKIFRFLASLRRYPVKLPILFDFTNSPFTDKLTIVLFECICYVLVSKYGYPVKVMCCGKMSIISEGIESSPLLLLDSEKKLNIPKYCEKFQNEIYQRHFRRSISKTAVMDGRLSILMQDIDSFLKYLEVKESYRSELSEVIVELVGNAGEHGDSECLIDIDVTKPYVKGNAEGRYRGLNFALVGFSKRLFGEELKQKLINTGFGESERYAYVKRALEKHREFFSEKYCENDFHIVAAFQHKISGRMNKSASGGAGLTKLIASLEDMADAHSCYMVTGNRAVMFRRELLEFDEDKWIGFNREKTFANAPPDSSVLASSDIYIPGTVFNLCFVMREDI